MRPSETWSSSQERRSLAALGAAVSGADYIKAGLGRKRKIKLRRCSMPLCEQSRIMIPTRGGGIRLLRLPSRQGTSLCFLLGRRKGWADVVMVDTAMKDGKPTFDFMSEQDLSDL